MLKFISRFTRYLILIAAVFVFSVFAVENKDFMALSLYPLPFTVEIAKFVALLLAFVLGYLAAIVHSFRLFNRQKRENKELSNKLKAYGEEITALKTESGDFK